MSEDIEREERERFQNVDRVAQSQAMKDAIRLAYERPERIFLSAFGASYRERQHEKDVEYIRADIAHKYLSGDITYGIIARIKERIHSLGYDMDGRENAWAGCSRTCLKIIEEETK